jgi:hypothetical protein
MYVQIKFYIRFSLDFIPLAQIWRMAQGWHFEWQLKQNAFNFEGNLAKIDIRI